MATDPTHTSAEGRALVLEPDENLASQIVRALQEAVPGAHIDLARSLEEAQRLVVNDRPDLFVLDVDAVPDLGQEFLYDLRTSHPNARAIVLTGVHLAAHREHAAGLGAIHFLEKPFPHGDFIDLAQALLSPSSTRESEKFQGTLSDLHLADIIQLKCMSGSSAGLQFTGPQGEKARIYFESGQVRHATAPGKEGVAAFNEIVNWKGGQISEVSGAGAVPQTIDLDWQILLMEAVRKMDEERNEGGSANAGQVQAEAGGRKVLVIDDSLMLLSFVKEILTEGGYRVTTAPTAEEGIEFAARDVPDLVLLDYVLPDMEGDEITRRLSENPATAKVPIVFMSGFGADLPADKTSHANVIGSLNKPFTSDLLLKTVENHMPAAGHAAGQSGIQSEPETAPVSLAPPPLVEPEASQAPPPVPEPLSTLQPEPVTSPAPEATKPISRRAEPEESWWSAPASPAVWPSQQPRTDTWASSQSKQPAQPVRNQNDAWASAPSQAPAEVAQTIDQARDSSPYLPPTATPVTAAPDWDAQPMPAGGTFFSGDTSFFSLNGALHTIGKNRLTGMLRSFWDKESVDLLAQNGRIVLVTTRDPELYCAEAPITLVNVGSEQTSQARAVQRETGCPLFLTLAEQGLILREPAVQLVHHYGQKLFAELWTARRVRFVFEQADNLPEYARNIPGEEDIDHWILSSLRAIQFQQLSQIPETEAGWIPAYTRDGFERVQKLRLTVAEAQFASQFNGARSLAQIAKNLRLDFSFARLTLFRFLALEIVECWPPPSATKQENRGMFQRLGHSIGLGD